MKPPFYYTPIIRLAMPIYRYMVKRKSQHLLTYERELNERFGKKYLPVPAMTFLKDCLDDLDCFGEKSIQNKGLIWCHAVSLGELNTAYPLLKILLNQGFGLWITSSTQTGFNRVGVLFKGELGKSVNHSFVPVDDLIVIRRFIAHARPVMAIFVETELWANILYELNRQSIPSVLVNARLTKKSFDGYAKFGKLSQSMMQNLTAIIAQDEVSADRFAKLGVNKEKIHVANSLKWANLGQLSNENQDLVAKIATWQIGQRPIWLVGSTHEGEEILMLEVQKQLLKSDKNPLLILVPRHPERFDEVAVLCQSSGLITHRRSQNEQITPDTQVYLVDSMGELLAWYKVCDVAVVAGSFVDKGGHNPIEPASFAKPVVMGRFVKNCEALVAQLSQVSALVQTNSVATDIAEAVACWLFDVNAATISGQAGADLVTQKRHSAQIQADILLNYLSSCQD